jgi:hypothetical protein
VSERRLVRRYFVPKKMVTRLDVKSYTRRRAAKCEFFIKVDDMGRACKSEGRRNGCKALSENQKGRET